MPKHQHVCDSTASIDRIRLRFNCSSIALRLFIATYLYDIPVRPYTRLCAGW